MTINNPPVYNDIPVVALAGGVGGAKLVDGLAQVVASENLTVIVNTGDDFEHLGLFICPDLDTVCYTLAGLANPATGWGLAGETWHALETMAALGGPAWFRLGDRDLGLHLERTRRKRMGQPLSQITAHFCRTMGIRVRVIPMSDDAVPTWVYTSEGELPFQEYFVRRQCRPQVTGFRFDGVERAHPVEGALEAIQAARLVVICPSNPWVSVDPILAVPGIRQAIQSKCAVAVSPIIGGQAVKGPAAKMYAELGIQPSALAVARHYAGWLAGFILDRQDAGQASTIETLAIESHLPASSEESVRFSSVVSMRALVTDTLMQNAQDRARLAKEVVDFGLSLS